MKRKHYLMIELMAVIFAVVIAFTYMLPRFLAVQNFNTPDNFPDPIFRREIEDILKVKPGGRFTKYDVSQIQNLRLNNVHMKNIKGIEHVTGLTNLHINSDQLSTIDLNLNVNLTVIRLEGRNLKQVDISGCKALTTFHLYYSAVEELDTSGNPELSEMYVTQNQIRFLDVTHNPKLLHLKCQTNPLEKLDVSGLRLLLSINCSNTYLSEIDITTNTALTGLYCFNTKLNSLDVSNNPNLSSLDGMNNAITELDISQNQNLAHLKMENCLLTKLDTSNSPNLQDLNLSGNRIVTVPDFRQNQKLNWVHLENNQLDCEDWEVFKQQGVMISSFIFFPQQNNTIKRCAEDIEMYKLNVNKPE